MHTTIQHRPELVDDRWAWVTDMADPNPDVTYYYGWTGTVHLEGCPHINHHTTFRPIEPTDPIAYRCMHCLRRDSNYQIAETRRRHEAMTLDQARLADPDLGRRVREERARRKAERGW